MPVLCENIDCQMVSSTARRQAAFTVIAFEHFNAKVELSVIL